ncbi:MAG TPA: glycerol-3-phosphate dehydrogenase/oxidase [Candidatus Polarisedimenticolia bacterium]|nr:glycerol-3-phosphate dehydrogenase/oxidase [Candidatus Polarisedimenticolia bacterium]
MTFPGRTVSEARKPSLSWSRDQHLQAISSRVFDLLVVGGGATGASIARDAALRGLDVALVERGDLAAGTSSRSTRFIHGGLRYLKTLEFGFVREGLRERATLMEVASHLVHSREFLFPAYASGMERWKLRLGIGMYDLLAGRSRLGGTRTLSPSGALLLEPTLRGRDLKGAVVYRDGAADDARLVVETGLAAVEAGATVVLHVEVERIIPSESEATVLVLRDRLGEASLGARAAVVINATGPWAGGLLHGEEEHGRRGGDSASRLRASRGSHLVVAREVLPVARVVVMPSRSDGRLLFAVPAGDFTYLGTTEVDHTGPLEPVKAAASEVDYILGVAAEIFEAPSLTRDKVLCTWAGIRPLVERPDTPTGSLSRDFRIVQEAPGVVTVVGGKLTSCRRMAQATVDLASGVFFSRTGRRSDPCITTWKLFPGSEQKLAEEDAEFTPHTTPEVVRHLRATYGGRAARILGRIEESAALGTPFAAGCPATPAEVIHAVEHEGAVRLADLLFRRLHPLMMEARMRSPQGKAIAEGASRIMAAYLGWTEEKRFKELADAAREWERDFSVPPAR